MTIVKTCIHHGDLHGNQVRPMPYKGKKILKCIQCEQLRSQKYADKNRDKLREKDKKYWKENKSKIIERRKEPEKIARRKDWMTRNKIRYAEFYKEKQTRYRNELADTYVKRKIIGNNRYLRAKDIPPIMVELSRANIILKRKINEKRITQKMNEAMQDG